jgi:hypothetical protein
MGIVPCVSAIKIGGSPSPFVIPALVNFRAILSAPEGVASKRISASSPKTERAITI